VESHSRRCGSIGPMCWTALLPLAALASAKSRLRAASPDEVAHRRLVTAIRDDTAEALRASHAVARVVAVSPDPDCLEWAARHGFVALAEAEPGLNAALDLAAAYAARAWPNDGLVALVGDLPAATGPALDALLARLGPGQRGFVADHEGVGTTLLAAAAGVPLQPGFGVDSAQRHREAGAVPLKADPGLRWDVDTPADLAAALATVPVGEHTRGVLVP
jgi:2-phospho-L-lactate/phosphoenolpyruvate guanylyltransferase